MGIYRRSNTNKQREGNLLNIFISKKNFKSYLITLYLETTNKIIHTRICHPSLLLSFYLLLYHLLSSNYFINNSFAPSFLHLLSFSSFSSSEILFNIFVIFSFASLLCHLFFSLLPIVLHILFQICIIYPLLNICLLILQFHIYSFSMTNKLDLFHTNNLVYSLFSNKIFDVLYCIVCVRSAVCTQHYYRRDSSSRACFAIGRCFLLIIRWQKFLQRKITFEIAREIIFD